MLVTRRTRDMRANDSVTTEHIERLESALDAADIENEELRQTVKSLQVQLQYMVCDRTYVA